METFLAIVAAILVFLIIAWEVFRRRAGIEAISARQLREMLQSSDESPLILDVRTATEYSLFHIPGARSEPNVRLRPEVVDDVERSRLVVVA